MRVRGVMRTGRPVGIGVLLLLLWAVPSPSSSPALDEPRPDPFAAIPDRHRPELRRRLSGLVAAYRAEQWSKVYRMFSQQFLAGFTDGMSEEKFIQERLYQRVRKFTPKGAVFLFGGEGHEVWTIRGCAELERRGLNENLEAVVDVSHENGELLFSEICVVLPCIHCEPRSCLH